MPMLTRGVVAIAMLLAAATTSCSDDDAANRRNEMTTDVWIDQVVSIDVPDFCTDPEREDQLPDLLTEQYGVAAEDLRAVAEQLMIRCEAAG